MHEAHCPYCQTVLAAADFTASCPICGATHHADCWTENSGCAVPACSGAPAEVPRAPIVVDPVSAPTHFPPPETSSSDLPEVNWPEGVPVPLPPSRNESNVALWAAIVIVGIVILVIIAVVLSKRSNRPYGAAPAQPAYALIMSPPTGPGVRL